MTMIFIKENDADLLDLQAELKANFHAELARLFAYCHDLSIIPRRHVLYDSECCSNPSLPQNVPHDQEMLIFLVQRAVQKVVPSLLRLVS